MEAYQERYVTQSERRPPRVMAPASIKSRIYTMREDIRHYVGQAKEVERAAQETEQHALEQVLLRLHSAVLRCREQHIDSILQTTPVYLQEKSTIFGTTFVRRYQDRIAGLEVDLAASAHFLAFDVNVVQLNVFHTALGTHDETTNDSWFTADAELEKQGIYPSYITWKPDPGVRAQRVQLHLDPPFVCFALLM